MSIVQYSHTEPPKRGVFWCKKKDVIPSLPLKPGLSCAPFKNSSLAIQKTRPFWPPPPHSGHPPLFSAEVPIFGGFGGFQADFAGPPPPEIHFSAQSAVLGGFPAKWAAFLIQPPRVPMFCRGRGGGLPQNRASKSAVRVPPLPTFFMRQEWGVARPQIPRFQ